MSGVDSRRQSLAAAAEVVHIDAEHGRTVHEAWKARGTALDVATAEGPLAALPLGTKKIESSVCM